MNDHGLSIIEILIASTILAFISIGVISITNNSIETKERVLLEDQDYVQMNVALMRIKTDFTQIVTPLFYSEKKEKKKGAGNAEDFKIGRFEGYPHFSSSSIEGHPIPKFKNENKQSFEFLTLSNRRRWENSSQSRLQWVRYFVKDEDNKTILYRQAEANNIYSRDGVEWSKIRAYPLVESLKSFQFFFWDKKSKKFVDSLRLVKEGVNSIRAIKVEYVWIDTHKNEIKGERIFTSFWPQFIKEKAKDVKK